jgi:hypothetical protein
LSFRKSLWLQRVHALLPCLRHPRLRSVFAPHGSRRAPLKPPSVAQATGHGFTDGRGSDGLRTPLSFTNSYPGRAKESAGWVERIQTAGRPRLRSARRTTECRPMPAISRHHDGLRHLSRPPTLVSRTRSTCGATPGFSSRALSIASRWVGSTALALSESAFLTA